MENMMIEQAASKIAIVSGDYDNTLSKMVEEGHELNAERRKIVNQQAYAKRKRGSN